MSISIHRSRSARSLSACKYDALSSLLTLPRLNDPHIFGIAPENEPDSPLACEDTPRALLPGRARSAAARDGRFPLHSCLYIYTYSEIRGLTAPGRHPRESFTDPTQRCQETCKARQNVRCQGCRTECSTLKPSRLASTKACQDEVADCRVVKMLSPDIFDPK